MYECTKDTDRIFTWSQTDTRKYDIVDKFKFTVDEHGIPQICSVEQMLEAQQNNSTFKATPESRPLFNEKYVISRNGRYVEFDIKALFSDAFRPGEVKSAMALQAVVMKLANFSSYKFYNVRRVEALAKGVIRQEKDAEGHITYRLADE